MILQHDFITYRYCIKIIAKLYFGNKNFFKLSDDQVKEAVNFYYNEFTDDERLKFERLLKNCQARRKTLKKRIEKLFDLYGDEVCFLTLTFNDDFLNKTNANTRKRYIKDFLNLNCQMYIANIDFGEANGREHYHALVSNRIDCEASNFYRSNYGNINFIKCYSANSTKLSKYIDKLVNHSFKDTTINRCIYSRNKRKSM